MKPLQRSIASATTLAALLLVAAVAPAASLVLDYTYAGGSFFSTATANGVKARASVQAAADYFSTILTDSLPQVSRPSNYISTPPGGGTPVTYSWTWEARFDNPSSGSEVSIANPVIPADQYRIYVGARDLPGSTLGVGGPGGYGSNSSGGYYTAAQLVEIQAIGADFAELLDNRSQGAGNFGAWGGSLSFDTTSNWNYDHTIAPVGGQNDLYSVALHELAHALGMGTSSEWNALVSAGKFTGPNAYAANGNSQPSVTGGHWANGTTSTVFGSSTSQEAAMDPTITTGTRKFWTTLDAAGLADIGWDVEAPGLPGDYNSDNLVDAADYTVWRDSVASGGVIGSYAEWSVNYGRSAAASGLAVPEPTTGVLLIIGACWGAVGLRRKSVI